MPITAVRAEPIYGDVHPELAKTMTRSDNILPHFVMNVLPAGARGVIFAAIFAVITPLTLLVGPPRQAARHSAAPDE